MSQLLSPEASAYATSYQAARDRRSRDSEGLFLPLEVLVRRTSGEAHLSVSFSGSSGRDVYVTQRADLIRAVKVTTRWLIVPWTVAKVLTPGEFTATFGDLVATERVDGEDFWVLRATDAPKVKSVIAAMDLGESFREAYDHSYLPEPERHEAGEP